MEKFQSSNLIKKPRKVTFDLHQTQQPTKANNSSKYRFQLAAHSITQGCSQLMDSLLDKQPNRANVSLKEDLPPVQKFKSLSVSIRKTKSQARQNEKKKKMLDWRKNKNEYFSNDHLVKVKYQKQQSLCVKLQRQEEDETTSKIREIYLEKENNYKKLTGILVNTILGNNKKIRGILGRTKTLNRGSSYVKISEQCQKKQSKFYYNYDSKKEGLNNGQNWKSRRNCQTSLMRIKAKHLNKQQLKSFTAIQKVIDQSCPLQSDNKQPNNTFVDIEKKSFATDHKQAQKRYLKNNHRVHCVQIES